MDGDNLFYSGTKILSKEIINLQKLLINLENEQFDYQVVLDNSINSPLKEMLKLKCFFIGMMLGLFLSLGIIFFKSTLKNNKKSLQR